MEKIKFVNTSSVDFGDQLGIPQQRRLVLAGNLDLMVKAAKTGQLRLVSIADIIDQIENFCDNRTEFLWCYTNHMQWLYKTGRMDLYMR